jgi:two-component system response regulator MprA
MESVSLSRILIVEDDLGVREALALALGLEGYAVLTATSAAEGLRQVSAQPDLILLDVLLPGSDGFSFLRELRERSSVPVILLTALDEVEWRVKGLREGADDYVVKPYALAELLARIQALLRRSSRGGAEALEYKGIRLDPEGMVARRGAKALELPPKAFQLLATFLKHPERVISREALMLSAWGKLVEDNTLEVHLSLLRRELGAPPAIQTLRGSGYRLRL